MIFELIRSGANTGKFNMEFDLRLVDRCNDEQAFFRLYYWKPYAISLGAHQDENEIDSAKARSEGIDVVKRPTGGRAILHAEELTYSVAYPLSAGLKPKELYEKISRALIRGLKLFDEKLDEATLEGSQPNFGALLKTESGALCFASTARNEVKFKGKKLIGSAQRKIAGKILQHGSILIGAYHRRLPHFLATDDETKLALSRELAERTTEIETILGRKISYADFEEAIIAGWEEEWGVRFSTYEAN